ncbi:MAG: signal peptidase II [Spirochaetaceae bacterium]
MAGNRLPVALCLFLLLLDQSSKILINKYTTIFDRIPLIRGLYLTNQNDNSIIYTDGRTQLIIQIVIPIVVVIILIISLIRSNYYIKLQRWTLWALISGVLGNTIDRIIRPEGKLVFIHLTQPQFIPIFNIADLTVVFCIIIMLISLIIKNRSNIQHE